jgi:hypothetical protein
MKQTWYKKVFLQTELDKLANKQLDKQIERAWKVPTLFQQIKDPKRTSPKQNGLNEQLTEEGETVKTNNTKISYCTQWIYSAR